MYNVKTTFLNIAKYGKIKTKFQFTRTGAQPHRNRKLIQFDYAQYCIHFLEFAYTVYLLSYVPLPSSYNGLSLALIDSPVSLDGSLSYAGGYLI